MNPPIQSIVLYSTEIDTRRVDFLRYANVYRGFVLRHKESHTSGLFGPSARHRHVSFAFWESNEKCETELVIRATRVLHGERSRLVSADPSLRLVILVEHKAFASGADASTSHKAQHTLELR